MLTHDEIMGIVATEAVEADEASLRFARPSGSAFPALETAVLEYLDTLDEKERVERIDDLLHRLNFERRLAALTPNQRESMNNRDLSPAARARLDEAKSEAEREELITMYARSQYFRNCAWVDYLNNGGTPPVLPNVEGEQPP
jgi:hypothetical protein